jgi:hypothetical protein
MSTKNKYMSDIKSTYLYFLIFPLLVLLSACGGGPNTHLPPPSIQASNLFYAVSARFFVGVTELNNGITFSASNCTELTPINSSSPLYLDYSCIVFGTGVLVFTA